ncbi:CDP-diacylglycerol--glycerol-3-phosphate 3-phosphatidyltransferase [Candidatus Woesearchaeota archaeon]|nr:CDP-diacylglycerol--glycerol-3-phosphate 3-phosphatidyltransferase [Candidatus Woesearchaeota archaeon]
MNPANKLTLLRGVLGIIITIFICFQDVFGYGMAVFLFAFAVWTDYYDGILARGINQETTFGKFMDPISDKVLVLAPLIALGDLGLIPLWMVLIVFIREILMMGMRSLAAAQGIILGANWFGKTKGMVQYGMIFISFVLLFVNEFVLVPLMVEVIYGMALVMVVMTFVTAVLVFINNKDIFKDS